MAAAMPPRRKTRKAAQQEAEEAETASQAGDAMSPGPSSAPGEATKLVLAALPDDVDFGALTSVLPDISPDNITAENVIACFRLIIGQMDQFEAKDKEIDELKAHTERLEVEFDQALQDRESSIKELESSTETLQSELQRIKKENSELSSVRDSLQSQLSSLDSNHSTSSVELETLRRKTEDIEREKRDLLGVITRLEEDAASSQEEITQLRETVKTSRRECQELESEIRDLKSSDTSTKFKVETLTQQLKLARDDNERIGGELSSKSEQFSAYRREKHAEIVQLQSKFETLTQENNHTVNTLQSLQVSHDSQSQQLSSSLQKVQDLTSQLADQEAKYSSEATNLRRLNQMMEERDAQGRALVERIEKDWESLGAKAAAREQKLRQALETEEERSAGLERELRDMKLVVDRINKGELPMPQPNVSGTPGSLQDLRAGLAMINRMQKTGKTFTEVYADYVKLQDEFVKKTIENERLDQALNSIMAEIEERTPVLTQQRLDFERVQSEAVQLASQLTRAISDRDNYLQRVAQLDQKLSKSGKENALLQQQLKDLGRQVTTLLREIKRRDDPSIPSDEEIAEMESSSEVGSIIDGKLVLFRSIEELQDQNVKLLAITRDLGNKLESEEREYKEMLDQEQAEAIREAHDAIQMLQSRIEQQQKSSQATIQAYVKECEALKIMLKRRDVNGLNGPVGNQADGSMISEQRLREVEGTFDSYREEINLDTARIREEAMRYQRDASQLGAELAKANAKLEHVNARYRLGQERLTAQTKEHEEISKRNRQLQEQYVKLEIASNHLTEELATVTSQTEILRNDCANLRAEKRIWEGIQSRLIEENKILSVERSRLSDLLVNVQKLHNDVDKSYEGDKRRLESQVKTMETQMQDLRSQLASERESSRKYSLQRDVELREIRSKLDITSESLSSTREKLVGAETSQKHLEDRVADLQRQLQTNEEKLNVYERRPPGTSGSAPSSATVQGTSDQDMKAEVAELRGALKAAELDLAAARNHVQQFQDISAASEAALAALSATHDEYKAQSETSIATFESQRADLEARISSLRDEFSEISEKNKELNNVLTEERRTFAEDKRVLEDTIFDITNAGKSSASDQASRELEIREQEQRAKDAEEKYSREVVAHAESIKQIEALRSDLNEARTTLRDQASAAEVAQAKLVSSEASWLQQRESLSKEISELDKRCKDLVNQNNVLHQHLDSVNSQVSRIRQSASTSNTTEGVEVDDDTDGRLAELRSVVSYLRKEKEIVDLQLELSKQEVARQKSQIDHLTKSLDEVRMTLSSEREQAAHSVENSKEHSELLEKINQLNVLRESNATLRAESDGHARRARQLQTSLDQLQSELEPVKEEARTARAELEEKDRQIARLTQENQQWKERNSQLLTKYDRIDPNDVQALRDEIEDLQIDARKFEEEKANLVKEAEAKATSLETVSTTLSEFRTKYQNLLTESRNRLGNLNKQITLLKENSMNQTKLLNEVTAERDQLKESQASNAPGESATAAELAKVKAEMEGLTAQKEAAERKLADEMQKSAQIISEVNLSLAKIQQERDALMLERTQSTISKPVGEQSVGAEISPDVQQTEAEKAELIKARDEAIGRVEAAQAEVKKHLEELKGLRFQNEKFQARLAENEKRKQAEGDRIAALAAKHKTDQEAAVIAATNKLRSELQAPDANTDALVAKHAEELKALEARLVAEHQKEMQEEVERIRKEASTSTEDFQEAIKSATERGRMEANTKIKLKDGMLQKAQQNIKQMEAQLEAWRAAGILPRDAPLLAFSAQPAGTPVASTSKSTTTTPAASASISAKTSGAESSAVNPAMSLPRKPSLPASSLSTATASAASATTTPSQTAAVRGARGVARGLRGAIRGATRGAAPGRGGAPVPVAPSASTSAANSPASGAQTGVSIMGAAGKRAREESETPDSLAKRIKPVEASSKPVALRRDRITPVIPPPS